MFLKTLTLKGFKSFADPPCSSSSPASPWWWGRTGAASPTWSTRSAGCWAPRRRASCARKSMDDVIFAARPSGRRWAAEVASPSTTPPPAADRLLPRSPSAARCSALATASTPSTACPAGCSTSRSCCRTRAWAASSTSSSAGPDRRGAERPSRGPAPDHRGGRRRPGSTAAARRSPSAASPPPRATSPAWPTSCGRCGAAAPARAPGRRRLPPRAVAAELTALRIFMAGRRAHDAAQPSRHG